MFDVPLLARWLGRCAGTRAELPCCGKKTLLPHTPRITRLRLGGAFSCLSARWNRFATVRNQGARSENL
jgi:hypothetical protein